MPVRSLRKVSRGQNGVAAFMLQCLKMDFHYCDWAGSSRGMNAFLAPNLPPPNAVSPGTLSSTPAPPLSPHTPSTPPPAPRNAPSIHAFASLHPSISITISPRPTLHPIIRATYSNGRQKVVCVRNMTPREIQQKAELVAWNSGEKNRRTKKPVRSANESVRGVWAPYFGKVGRDGRGDVMAGR